MYVKTHGVESDGELFKMQQEAAIAQAREMRALAQSRRKKEEEIPDAKKDESEEKKEKQEETVEIKSVEEEKEHEEHKEHKERESLSEKKLFSGNGLMGGLFKKVKLDDLILGAIILLLMHEETDDDLILILIFVFLSGL